MPRIDIKTILGFTPPCPKHELLVITRGATASIDYNLFDKVSDMENIDQMTFIFKQDKKIISFKGTDGSLIGWIENIRIWDGRSYPYQVGNNSGTTGFYGRRFAPK